MIVNADNDNRLDVLWYGTGSIANVLELASHNYVPEPLTINGDYDELWGSFDGNDQNLTDILWWANTPSGPPDPFWEANGHGFVNAGNVAPHVDPTRYFPITGHFQPGLPYPHAASDGTDILWANDTNYNDPPIMWWSYDVDGTSNPPPVQPHPHPVCCAGGQVVPGPRVHRVRVFRQRTEHPSGSPAGGPARPGAGLLVEPGETQAHVVAWRSAMICRPTGRPVRTTPAGTLIAGEPQKLASIA